MGDTDGDAASGPAWGRRVPVAVFVAVLIYAAWFWLHAGRAEWFYLDEWDFLARRKASHFGDLFRPHNEHWTTIPILVYRAFYWLFGLRDYFPYRLVVLVCYLAAAVLLYVLIRRSGVQSCIAVAAASAFALFGAGWENAIKPFEMTFTGGLVFGLVHLLLADHDGPFDRRDRLGLVAGFIGLMFSGIAVTMVAVVGLAVWLRRGWRLALVHVAPLAAVYSVWWLTYGRTGKVRQLGVHHPSTVGSAIGFVVMGLRGAFAAIGHYAGLGAVLALLLVGGLGLARSSVRDAARRAQLAAPLALLAGSIVFLAITAVGRASFGSDYARISRYVSLTVAMLLPALAVALNAIVSRWRVLLPLAVAVLVVGIPANLRGVARALVGSGCGAACAAGGSAGVARGIDRVPRDHCGGAVIVRLRLRAHLALRVAHGRDAVARARRRPERDREPVAGAPTAGGGRARGRHPGEPARRGARAGSAEPAVLEGPLRDLGRAA